MILDINEENLDLLAITGCPVDLRVDGACMLRDDGVYDGSCITICRACWLKWLSKESEDSHE